MTPEFWSNRKVLVTGHTGFKGSWLCLLLEHLGAKVSGFALEPPTSPALFEIAAIEKGLENHLIGDVRDSKAVAAALDKTQPEVIFHLAAQPLVRESYAEPLVTLMTNVMGIANLLEGVRNSGTVKSVVNVTTDKCYQNNEWPWAYRENEPLGGHDPYSASKACSELVTSAYRESFLRAENVGVASARAGNVIGGGDWAKDRLIPDFYRAILSGQALEIRSPGAIRPWQHVLEPLSGYILLAQALDRAPDSHAKSWNFGPEDADAKPVQWILDQLSTRYGANAWQLSEGEHVHEAHYLKLDSSRAKAELGWTPRWNLGEALEKTAAWQDALQSDTSMREFSLAQIAQYQTA